MAVYKDYKYSYGVGALACKGKPPTMISAVLPRRMRMQEVIDKEGCVYSFSSQKGDCMPIGRSMSHYLATSDVSF